ncbi:hypothetical protein [Faecalispora anaeroviscerum]|uniref:hypothetical protein n=1 Tax=Faecalispora anaeroviscerum TaxID=2991836 RepID=UPI0024BBAFDE|nr:hypothetical protein [Faecalispora anaeroviscerum]
MEEMTVMMEQTPFQKKNELLQELLRAAIEHFRNGEDILGMESFLRGIDELERVVEIDQNSQQPKIEMKQLLPAMRELYFYVQNQDLTGIADLLEDTVFPLISHGFERRDYA